MASSIEGIKRPHASDVLLADSTIRRCTADAEGVTPLDASSGSRRHKWIGADYFETLRIPLLYGRPFTWADIHDRMPVAIVSETLAREYWGSAEAAMGKLVAARPDPPRWYEVTGVAADVREFGLDQDPPVQVYWPHPHAGSPVD
ncbi:MAG: ABC transporter permease [Gemmatimonadota bacterium]|nr:MAG: ABC transporter permease [Gemmatimonadota bacterium]